MRVKLVKQHADALWRAGNIGRTQREHDGVIHALGVRQGVDEAEIVPCLRFVAHVNPHAGVVVSSAEGGKGVIGQKRLVSGYTAYTVVAVDRTEQKRGTTALAGAKKGYTIGDDCRL